MQGEYITHCGIVCELDGSRFVHVVEHGPSFGFDWHMEYSVRIVAPGMAAVETVRLAPDYCPFPDAVCRLADLPSVVRDALTAAKSV